MLRFLGMLVFGCVAAAPGLAVAQERMPRAGTTAVGVDIGAFVPSDDQLDNAPLVSVLYEYYVTPRVSLRTDFGWADPSFKREAADSLRQLPLRLDILYNWEGGNWHPFVGAGLGAHFVQLKDNGRLFGESETKLGVSLGGGIERFIARSLTLKGEARYHAVRKALGGRDPSGLAITGGLKVYF